jgi:hypothetical protein
LLEREKRISRLEAAWKFVGEDGDVLSGFRSAEFSSLMKARAAYRIGRDHGLDDVAKQMADWQPPTAPVRRGHGDSGDWPANVSMTKEPEAPAAARVRGRRGAAHA